MAHSIRQKDVGFLGVDKQWEKLLLLQPDFGLMGLLRGCSDTPDTGHLSTGCYGNRTHLVCFFAFCMLAS